MPTQICAVLNLSPESFSQDGESSNASVLHKRVTQLVHDGANIIDIWGQSTAPGSRDVTISQEVKRLEVFFQELPRLKHKFPQLLWSLDTFRPEIAEKGIEAGVDIINDVSGGRQGMIPLINAHPEVTYVLMYNKNPSGFADLLSNKKAQADTLLLEQVILPFFEEQISKIYSPERIVLGPGMGAFISDNPLDSLSTILHLRKIKEAFGLPVLIGASRKGFLGKITLDDGPTDRVGSSLAAAMVAVQNWADYLRVHDVRFTKHAIQILEKFQELS